MNLKRALFIEVDSVVIDTISGNIKPIHSADWKLNLDMVDLIGYYSNKGCSIVLVNANDNLAEKEITEIALNRKLSEIASKIEKINKIKKNSIQYIYYDKLDTFRTLPNPGMFYEIAEDVEISLCSSVYIGKSENRTKTICNNAGIARFNIKEKAFNNIL